MKVDEVPPPRLGQYGAISDPIVMPPASIDARDQLEAMAAWNREGREPPQTGFSRGLPQQVVARFGAASRGSESRGDPHSARADTAAGVTFWGTRVTVRDAYGIRMHLSRVDLPPGTRFWSYGTDGLPVSFGLELRGPDGDLWTPITFGETAYLDVQVPSGTRGGFSVLEVVEIRPFAAATQPPCALDAACVDATTFPAIEEARKAVALLHFMIGNRTYGCTGTLLNDTAEDGTPYLLTAHHCMSTQAVVSTLQAFWDYDAPSCGGLAPSLSAVPSSSGGTLLATGTTSDFTLVRLTSVPSGRSFMGWDARTSAVPVGTTTYRVSHPASYVDPSQGQMPQQFSEAPVVDPAECYSGLANQFVYTAPNVGYAYRGSSGSATLLGTGQVVGQAKEVCPNLIETCAAPFDLLDGAFSRTYPFVARWLDAPSPACVPDTMTLCLGTRFQVNAHWMKVNGEAGDGVAVSLTPDSGYFWFFDPTNVEIITKVVDGCPVNGHAWVFASGLTNVGITLTYTDLGSGGQAVYRSNAGTAFQPVQDTSAFPCP